MRSATRHRLIGGAWAAIFIFSCLLCYYKGFQNGANAVIQQYFSRPPTQQQRLDGRIA